MSNRLQKTRRDGLEPYELAILDPEPVPSIVDWAPTELILPPVESPIHGLFSFNYSPWARELCGWCDDPDVKVVVLSAALQMGKTLVGSLWMYHRIKFRPQNMIIVMTDENTLKRRMRRLRATFLANRFLMDRIGNRIENLHIGEATELPGMLLYLAWSNSAASMASDPIALINADEVALWEPTVGSSETHALDHLRGRQEAFPDSAKMIVTSSPRNVADPFDREFEAGDRCEYWVPCHKCSYWHIPRWRDPDSPGAHAVLDKGPDGDWLPLREYEAGGRVRYLCPSCGAVWSDYARAAALQQGRWLPAGVTMGRAGRVEGTITPSPYKSARIRSLLAHPKLRSLDKMAVQWVRGQIKTRSGDKSGLRHFLNHQEAQPWREETSTTDVQKLASHIGGWTMGRIATGSAVPWGVQVVTVGIDVQDNWFRVVVMGWGYLYESWILDAATVETSSTDQSEAFAPLASLLVRTWPLENGLSIPPSAVALDCGYRPEPVYDFCRSNRALVFNGNVVPVRGTGRRMNRSYQKFPVDGVLNRYELNVLSFKDTLWRLLYETQSPGAGYMHLPKDVTGQILSELASEHRIAERGYPLWEPKKEGLANHAWDAAVYNLFLAQLVGVGRLGPLAQSPRADAPAAQAKPPRREGRDRGFLSGLPRVT